jgi:hypothetical protein
LFQFQFSDLSFILLNRKTSMIKKLLQALAFSSFLASYAFGSDISDVATAVTALSSVTGNAAVGVNTSSGNATIGAKSEGSGSNANAGLAVIDSTASGGKTANIAVGYNSGTANITAEARQGGSANAGLAVIKSR